MQTLPALSPREFERLRDLVYRLSGVSLKDTKKDLLAGRLARRLRHHGLAGFGDYLRMVEGPGADPAELTELVNCITTNKTSFFRENHHFAYLREVMVPAWQERARRTGTRTVRIWSAGCSTGEEAYSIAMTLHDRLPERDGWSVQVLATDIDTDVLSTAAEATYPGERVSDLPGDVRGYVQKHGGELSIRDDVRAHVSFAQLNLIAPDWQLRGPFDVIFCRNVVIYFDKPTQQRLFERFARLVAADGRLIIGHSENLTGLTDRFILDGQTIYRPRVPGDGRRHRTTRMPKYRAHSTRIPIVNRTERTQRTQRTWTVSPQLPAKATGLQPVIIGEIGVSANGQRFSTLLGSCVSACIFDPVARIGGVNHFAMPEPGPGDAPSARHATFAMSELITRLVNLGANRARLVAKLFGGAQLTPEQPDIGAQNARAARQLLADANIPVAFEALGGTTPLEIHVLSDRGTVLYRERSRGDL